MNAIINFFKQHEKISLGASLGLLAIYLLLRKREQKERNILEVSLKELMQRANHPQVTKVIITSNPKTQSTFRRNLVSFIKSKLIQQNGVKVLINCSPQKLLKAGCQCYLQSMETNDSDYEKYYINALKTQFLIEDTIISIETINRKNPNDPIVMICDNNPMDIRLMNETDALWEQTLQRYEIKEKQIQDCYNIVIHAVDESGVTEMDKRITQIWKNHPYYVQVAAEEGMLRQKYDQVYRRIMEYLSEPKEKPVLIS